MPPSQPLLRPTTGGRDPLRYDRIILLGLLPCLALWAAVSFAVYPYLPVTPDGDPNPPASSPRIGMIAGRASAPRLVLLARAAVPAHERGPRPRPSDAPPEDDS